MEQQLPWKILKPDFAKEEALRDEIWGCFLAPSGETIETLKASSSNRTFCKNSANFIRSWYSIISHFQYTILSFYSFFIILSLNPQ